MNFFDENEFLWDKLQKTEKPIIVYGTGEGADKLFSLCDRFGITVSAIFASNEFVRDREFHGYKVQSFDEICEQFNDFVVLLSFAVFKDDLYEKVLKLAEKYELYAPDMPLFGGDILDREEIIANAERLQKAYDILADEQSKKTLECVLKYKYTGKIDFLCECETERAEIFPLLNIPQNPVYLDLGAYDGDTVVEFFGLFPNTKRVIAVEPDRQNFKKLKSNPQLFGKNVRFINKAVWSHFCELSFSQEGSRNSHASAGNETVLADSIDNFCCGKLDFIKMDVEGAETQALNGMSVTAKDYAPSMAVSAYHKTNDFFELALTLSEMFPNHKIYLRHHKYIPAWETNLYAAKSNS